MGSSESQPPQPEPVLKLQRSCGYWFKGNESNELLRQILTHKGDPQLFLRLELAGEQVLTLLSLDYLEEEYPEADVEELKKKQAEMISEDKLAQIATTLQLENLFKLLSSPEGQAVPKKSWSSAVKILIGGIYKDAGGEAAGTKAAHICIRRLWGLDAAAEAAAADQEWEDYTTKGLDHATNQLFDD